MRFASPLYFWLLLLVPTLVFYYLKTKHARHASLIFSSLESIKEASPPKGGAGKGRAFLAALRIAALILIIISLARPQGGVVSEEVESSGVDIMLALDISTSMEALDFKPQNRLEAAKEELKRFVKRRHFDRIGLVVFAKESITQCPLTLDYTTLLGLVDKVHTNMVEDGTAIGMAIANATNRLRHLKAKSKLVILLTDGLNNAGEIDPITATKAAAALGIKIYTIGAGRPGKALYPIDDPVLGRRYIEMETQIDEEMLTKIAQITGGRYYRAKDEKSLSDTMAEIDRLEKTKVEVKRYTDYKELANNLLMPALLLLLFELVLANTKLRVIP